jgi:hypothetical protein
MKKKRKPILKIKSLNMNPPPVRLVKSEFRKLRNEQTIKNMTIKWQNRISKLRSKN